MIFHTLLTPKRNGFVYAFGIQPENVAWKIDHYEIMGTAMSYDKLVRDGYHPGLIETCEPDDPDALDVGYILRDKNDNYFPHFTVSSRDLWKEIAGRDELIYRMLRKNKYRAVRVGMRIVSNG